MDYSGTSQRQQLHRNGLCLQSRRCTPRSRSLPWRPTEVCRCHPLRDTSEPSALRATPAERRPPRASGTHETAAQTRGIAPSARMEYLQAEASRAQHRCRHQWSRKGSSLFVDHFHLASRSDQAAASSKVLLRTLHDSHAIVLSTRLRGVWTPGITSPFVAFVRGMISLLFHRTPPRSTRIVPGSARRSFRRRESWRAAASTMANVARTPERRL